MKALRVRGSELLTIGDGAENAHKLALRSRRSYPAIRGYIDDAENRERIDLDVLTSILVDGLGFTYEELLDLRIRDIFRLVEIPVNY
jgi:hypothetical protein